MSDKDNQHQIHTEIEIENNAATWLRQMVTTMSITIAIIAYFEIRGDLLKCPIALVSVGILLITSVSIGIMSSLAYQRRKNSLIADGALDYKRINEWYLFAGIASVIGFIGVGIAVIRNKAKH